MGLSPMKCSASVLDTRSTLPNVVMQPVMPPNPDPAHFAIEYTEQIGAHLVACIRYPNCTTYEGRKVLVFANLTALELLGYRLLDPHFSQTFVAGTAVPVARFEPTQRGIRLARITAAAL